MNHESPDNPFRLGGRYTNRKGSFIVIEFSGEHMRIRWDSGEEATDTIDSQARILRNMQREDALPSARSPRSARPREPISPPSTLGTFFAAALNPNADFATTGAQCCSRCHHDLAQHPVIMLGPQPFCYRCAKTEYPVLMDEARRARDRESRRSAPARREYKQALARFENECSIHDAQLELAADAGFFSERNKWIVAWSIAIPCGIAFPIVGLFAILPMLVVIELIRDRQRRERQKAFDATHAPPPPFQHPEPKKNYVPDPVVSLHPDCYTAAFIGVGYNRNLILQRDDYTCQSCGRRLSSFKLEVHHVLPRAQKGSDAIRNLVTLCKECHFEEDWFDHVHKDNHERIDQRRREIDERRREIAKILPGRLRRWWLTQRRMS